MATVTEENNGAASADAKRPVRRRVRARGIQKICGNCMDFNEGVCDVRYTILKDKTRTPMKRKPTQAGCQVFMYAP